MNPCLWVWDDWEFRRNMGDAHQYTYSMHMCWYVCMFLLCLPPPQPPYKGIHKGGRPPKAAAPLCGGGRRPPPLYGGWGGGRHTKNIQTYQQVCVEYVYWCIYLPYSLGIPIIPIILYSVTSLSHGVWEHFLLFAASLWKLVFFIVFRDHPPTFPTWHPFSHIS